MSYRLEKIGEWRELARTRRCRRQRHLLSNEKIPYPQEPWVRDVRIDAVEITQFEPWAAYIIADELHGPLPNSVCKMHASGGAETHYATSRMIKIRHGVDDMPPVFNMDGQEIPLVRHLSFLACSQIVNEADDMALALSESGCTHVVRVWRQGPTLLQGPAGAECYCEVCIYGGTPDE